MIEKIRNLSIKKIAVISALSLFVSIMSFAGLSHNATDKLNFVRKANEAYLVKSQERAVGGFLTLSVIKTGLAVIEGSEVKLSILGIGGSLQAGDSVQAIYDLIDWLWKTSFFGGVMLTALSTLLGLSSIISLYAFGVCAFFFSIFLPLSKLQKDGTIFRTFYSGLVLSFSVFLICQFAIPLSIWSASKLSSALTLNMSLESERNFQELGAVFDNSNSEGMVKNLASRFNQIIDSVKSRTRNLVVSGIKYMTAYLFDCLLFPLAMFEIMKRLIFILLRRLFDDFGYGPFNRGKMPLLPHQHEGMPPHFSPIPETQGVRPS